MEGSGVYNSAKSCGIYVVSVGNIRIIQLNRSKLNRDLSVADVDMYVRASKDGYKMTVSSQYRH